MTSHVLPATAVCTIDARLIKRLPVVAGATPFRLDLHLQAGPGITVLLGASGSGKTLTLNCLAGFATPDEGRILVDQKLYFDADARINLPAERRRCGYLFQEDSLFPHLSILQNLRFAGRLRQLRGLNLRRRINDLLEAFELTPLARHKPAELSGGQKQRAALARILIGDPRLILLDEPTRGLDTRLRQAFYEILRQARARLEIPLLLVTHDLDECFALADTIGLMENGRLLQIGPAAGVVARPASLAAARLLGLHMILPAEIQALDPGRNTSLLRVLNQEIEGPYLPGHLLGDRGFLCVRSSEVQLNSPALFKSGAKNEILLLKERVALAPEGIRLYLEGGFTITLPESRHDEVRLADRVWLLIPSTAVTFLTN